MVDAKTRPGPTVQRPLLNCFREQCAPNSGVPHYTGANKEKSIFLLAINYFTSGIITISVLFPFFRLLFNTISISIAEMIPISNYHTPLKFFPISITIYGNNLALCYNEAINSTIDAVILVRKYFW